MKKIMYIASPPDWGGATVALYNLILELKDKYEIVVVFPNINGRLIGILDSFGVRYYVTDYRLNVWPTHCNNPLRYLYRLIRTLTLNIIAKYRIAKWIKTESPDIVHCNVGPLDLSLDACKKLKIPHVWHIREYQDLDFGMKSFPSKDRFLNRIHSHGNYCISITKGVFNHWRLRDFDRVIYDGVYDSENIPCLLDTKDKYILFVGRIEEAKGALDCIRAFCTISRKYPDYELLLVGRYNVNSQYYIDCVNCVEGNGIQDRVRFLGERDDVYSLMSKAKSIVVSSRFEGFGFITAEAMLNGCYVIGRNTGGTKEQLDICREIAGRDLGYRFDDIYSLANGICYSIDNDTSTEVKRAREIVIEKYSSVAYASAVNGYYSFVIQDYYGKKS